MKTKVFFRMIVLVAMTVAGVVNSELKAQEPNFITNEVKEGDLIKSKVIYRLDNSLYRYMKYDYSYDDQNRMTSKNAFKWDSASEKWIPYFKINYLYSENEIIMEYGRWNKKHKAYDDSVERSVYELNGKNMPVAYVNYKWDESVNEWNINIMNNLDVCTGLVVYAN